MSWNTLVATIPWTLSSPLVGRGKHSDPGGPGQSGSMLVFGSVNTHDLVQAITYEERHPDGTY